MLSVLMLECVQEAIGVITKDIDQSIGGMIVGLWEEYEAAVTPEARLVKQIDKFEFALQAHEYEKGMR